MVQLLQRAFSTAFYFTACVVVSSLIPVLAQTAVPAGAKSKAIEVPQSFLAGILAGTGGSAVIERFLHGDGAPAALVAKRAAAVMRQLGAQRSVLEPEDLLDAVDRVVHVAARSFSYATVMRTAVAGNYRPDNAVLAWDFGPPGGKVMPCFVHIRPNDKRISSRDITAHFQISANSLLADGIFGMRRIELDLADGKYRIILITRNLGDFTLSNLPFGREVRINGMTPIVSGRGGIVRSSPEAVCDWQAVLSSGREIFLLEIWAVKLAHFTNPNSVAPSSLKARRAKGS